MYLFLDRSQLSPEVWNSFVHDHRFGWWWHRAEWLDYCQAYSGSSDASFAVMEGETIVAICPAVLGINQDFVGGGAPLGQPLLCQGNALVSAALWGHLGLKARLAQVSKGWYRSLPQTSMTGDYRTLPFEFPRSTQTDPILTRILPVHAGVESSLWKGIRKSYRGEIRQMEHEYRIEIIYGKDYWVDVMRELHDRAAGRETRPRSTWAMMARWMRDKRAVGVVAYARSSQDPVGYSYFLIYKDQAYYASSAGAAQSLLQWTFIQWFRAQKGTYYELGWQTYPTDPKYQNIAFFKRGFGGRDFPISFYRPRFGEPIPERDQSAGGGSDRHLDQGLSKDLGSQPA